ncbi:hypothetical protein Agub_g8888 [Astrephomene gubernaculifera]|uniref:SBP-type domain-containing protein n=1 Tax=Astrephomene gubernaculifera TaxID=47775 RepID=A0AAD3HNJ3_9CHLO|nr:hypothetical protein Agub_g8888 [Astrephomene gubernaculifera]
MSSARTRRRVEDEAAEEEAWSVDAYEWDPKMCLARKKRVVASGPDEDATAKPVGLDLALPSFLNAPAPVGGGAADPLHIPQLPPNISVDALPVLDAPDRADGDQATVCEVVGCGASLQGLKRYYVRMRVCEKHLHAAAIVVNGTISRFCQQCAKFQFIGEFSGTKKSCSATLERHNARHRAKVMARMQQDQMLPKRVATGAGYQQPLQQDGGEAGAASRNTGGATAAGGGRGGAKGGSTARRRASPAAAAAATGGQGNTSASSDTSVVALGGQAGEDVSGWGALGARSASALPSLPFSAVAAAAAGGMTPQQEQQKEGGMVTGEYPYPTTAPPAPGAGPPFERQPTALGAALQQSFYAEAFSCPPARRLVTTGVNGQHAGCTTGTSVAAGAAAHAAMQPSAADAVGGLPSQTPLLSPPPPPPPPAAVMMSMMPYQEQQQQGAAGWQHPQQQQQQQMQYGGESFGPDPSQRTAAFVQQQQQQQEQQHYRPLPPPPLDVQRALEAFPSHLVPYGSHQAPPAALGLTMAPASDVYGAEYGTTPSATPYNSMQSGGAAAANYNGSHSNIITSYAAAPGYPLHAAAMKREESFSHGSTPVASNNGGVGGAAADGSDMSGSHSHATARQAVLAGGSDGVGCAADGRPLSSDASALPTNSRASHSAAVPSPSGGGAMMAPSPGISCTEGVSAARISGSGDAGGGGGRDGSAAASSHQVVDVAARISNIMQELCPLIAQYKQQMAHRSAETEAPPSLPPNMHDGGFMQHATPDSATATASAGSGGSPPQARSGSNSLPHVVDAAVAMMKEASQLAASLQPQAVGAWGGAQDAAQPPPAQPRLREPSPGAVQQQQVWRGLQSYPGIVVNEAAVAKPINVVEAGLGGAATTGSGFPPRAPSLSSSLPQQPSLPAHNGVPYNVVSSGYAVRPGGSGALQVPPPPPPTAHQQPLPQMQPQPPPLPLPLATSSSGAGGGGVQFAAAAVHHGAVPGAEAPSYDIHYHAQHHPDGLPYGHPVPYDLQSVPTAIPVGLAPRGPPPETLAATGGGGPPPGVWGAAAGAPVDEEDDELFHQLLSYLEEPKGPAEHFLQQQQQHQQQHCRAVATVVQHAVQAHQQVVQSMPYGASVRPQAWQPQPPPLAATAPGSAPAASQGHAAPPLMPPGMYDTSGGGAPYSSWGPTAPPPQHPYPQHPYPHMQALPAAGSGTGGGGGGGMQQWGVLAGGFEVAEESDGVDPRELARVSLKAMNVLPHELPSNLRSSLRRWLKEARAEALQATLRPGCLQLIVDILRTAPSASSSSRAAAAAAADLASQLIPAHDADQAAADVFRILGQRLRDTYVQVERSVLQIRVGERPVVLSWEQAAEEGGLEGAKYPQLTGCSQAAVCAGSSAALELRGQHLAHPRTKAFARLRGHDLPATLLPPTASPATTSSSTDGSSSSGSGSTSRLRMQVGVPAGGVGVMVVEVGVGHLLGDGWPVLVLPRGQEGAAEELRRVQRQAEEQEEAAEAARRGFRRLLTDLAFVLETLADAKAAAASAAAAAAAACASSMHTVHPSATTVLQTAGDSPLAASPPPQQQQPQQQRSSSPGSGSGGGSSRGSRSDSSTTPASAAGWSYTGSATDTLNSSTAVGSTLASSLATTNGSAMPGPGAPVRHHPAATAAAAAPAAGGAAAGAAAAAAAGVGAGVRPAAAAVPNAPPPPPAATLHAALGRTGRLLRYVVSRGLPNLTSLLLAVALGLAQSLDPSSTSSTTTTASSRYTSTSAPTTTTTTAAPHPHTSSTSISTLSSTGGGAVLGALLVGAGVDPQALLPLAVLAGGEGGAASVGCLAAFAERVAGRPLRLDLPQGPGGLTPLHLAALLPDGGALAAHLVASQPWAAWAWLCTGWSLPLPPLPPPPAAEGADEVVAGAQVVEGSGVDGAVGAREGAEVEEGGEEEAEAGGGEEEEDEQEEEQEVPVQPAAVRLTPGSLCVLLGNKEPLRRAVALLQAPPRPAAAAAAVAAAGDVGRGTLGGGGGGARGGVGAGGLATGASAESVAALAGALEAWGRTGAALLTALCEQLAGQRL